MTAVQATSAFAGEPQPVEVFHRGVWYSGELLGWRHDDEGRCLARVRCRVNGLRHSAWVELSALRLPRSGESEDSATPLRVAPHSRPPVPVTAPFRKPLQPPEVLASDRDEPSVGRQWVDETQPHVLMPVRRQRPQPVARTLPPPRYPRPSEQTGSRWASAV